MINSAADYTMLDMTGKGRYVTGNILPAREGAAKRALKYEDLLFLKEGKLERQNWKWPNGTPPAKVAPPGRFLNRTVFEDAVCSGTWNDYRDKEKTITLGIVPVADKAALIGDNPPTAYGAIESLVGGVVQLGAFSAERTLKIGKLETAYGNMGKLKRTMEWMPDSDLWSRRGRWRRKTWPQQGQPIDEYESWNADYTTLYNFSGSYNGSSVKEYEETLKNKKYPYAVAAWLILPISTGVDGGTSTERGKAWLDLIVIGCEVTQRAAGSGLATVSWTGLSGASIARGILESHGETYYGEPTRIQSPEGKQQSVDIGSCYILVENEFPATAQEQEEEK